MAALVKLKQDIQFNGRLAGLLDALKSVASQQFQSLERTLKVNPAFYEAVETIAGTFDLEHLDHPFTRPEGPMGVIAITSDTGLLGGLNQQVMLAAIQQYRRAPGELLVIGERGVAYAREAGLACHAFPSSIEQGREPLARQVRDYVLNKALAGRFNAATIVYPRALSFTTQRVELVQALPCTAWFRKGETARGVRGGPVTLESGVGPTLEYLAWLWLGERLYDVLGMARLAELAARSVHLEQSSQELQRRGKKLWLKYFRARHEVIDQSMRELFAARSLYGQDDVSDN